MLNDGFDNRYDLNEILPIPLTPEILEKAGFVKDDFWWGDGIEYYKLHPFDVRFGNETDKNENELDTFFFGQEEMPVVYLHQLQNLYFAIVGKELTISL